MTYDTTPKNVTVTVTVGADDKLIVHYTVEGVTGEDKPVEITNTFDEPKVNVEVEKIWDDDDDQDAIRPEKITVTLKRSYTKTDGTEVKDEVVTFAQGDTNKNPVEITKTIKVVDGKDAQYLVQSDATGYTITNLSDKSVVRFNFDASDRSWSLETNGSEYKFMSFVDDSHVRMITPDGSWRTVELNQQGVMAYEQLVSEARWMALK